MCILAVAGLISGCASVSVREAQFLINDYQNEVQKNVSVLPFIDAREDKMEDLSDFLSTKVIQTEYVVKPLKQRGYVSCIFKYDIGGCGSLADIRDINDVPCLSGLIAQNEGMILLISVDRYAAPEGKLGLSGNIQVSGILYSGKAKKIIWKDTFDSDRGGAYFKMFGLGGITGGLLLKAMNPNFIFRTNVFTAVGELLKSIPPLFVP
jgi:hypothetical protein